MDDNNRQLVSWRSENYTFALDYATRKDRHVIALFGTPNLTAWSRVQWGPPTWWKPVPEFRTWRDGTGFAHSEWSLGWLRTIMAVGIGFRHRGE